MSEIEDFTQEDLEAAIVVIRGDKRLRDAYTRAKDHTESLDLLRRAAVEHRRIRTGAAS